MKRNTQDSASLRYGVRFRLSQGLKRNIKGYRSGGNKVRRRGGRNRGIESYVVLRFRGVAHAIT